MNITELPLSEYNVDAPDLKGYKCDISTEDFDVSPDGQRIDLPEYYMGTYCYTFFFSNTSGSKKCLRVWKDPKNPVREGFFEEMKSRIAEIQRLLRLSDIKDYLLNISYHDVALHDITEGINYPGLTMDCVRGLSLSDYIYSDSYSLDRSPSDLLALAKDFLRMCKAMREAKVAHCDLSLHNVMVENVNGCPHLRLIDYDTLYTVGMGEVKVVEAGTHGFHHPSRFKHNIKDENSRISDDNFAQQVIYLGLLALGSKDKIFEMRSTLVGDNMLFTNLDFQSVDAFDKAYATKLIKENFSEDHEVYQRLMHLRDAVSLDHWTKVPSVLDFEYEPEKVDYTQIDALVQQNDQLKTEIDNLKAEIQNRLEENKLLSKIVDSQKDSIDQLQESLDDLYKKLKLLEQQNQDLSSKNDELDKQVTTLSQENQDLQAENKALIQDNKDLSIKLAAAQSDATTKEQTGGGSQVPKGRNKAWIIVLVVLALVGVAWGVSKGIMAVIDIFSSDDNPTVAQVEAYPEASPDDYNIHPIKGANGGVALALSNGNIISKSEYEGYAYPSSEDSPQSLDRIFVSNHGDWGMVDTSGQEVMPLKFSELMGGSQGRVWAKLKNFDAWECYDLDGKPVTSLTSTSVPSAFHGGMAAIQKTDSHLFGFVNLDGRLVIPYRYGSVDGNPPAFYNGSARVTLDGRQGTVNQKGVFSAD